MDEDHSQIAVKMLHNSVCCLFVGYGPTVNISDKYYSRMKSTYIDYQLFFILKSLGFIKYFVA